MRPRSSPPLWFIALTAAALGLLCRVLAPAPLAGGGAGPDEPQIQLAFWSLIVTIASAIWTGVQVAGRVTLEILRWSVQSLWVFARSTYNAVVGFGKAAITGFRKAWDFLQATYTRVLKPAWEKFWNLFDRVRRGLESIVRPVFKFLEFLKGELLGFYQKWIRPVLDVIGIARKVLRVLTSLGVDWARALDRKLAELERRIDAPFRYALEQINQVINVLNRVVTADGLFQRLALIRSIERDIREVSRAFVNWRARPVTDEEWAALRKRATERTMEDVRRDVGDLLSTGGGKHGPWVQEMALIWTKELAGK